MNFSAFKERTINILGALNTPHFRTVMDAIQKIQPVSASGFSDIEAKAKVLQLALQGVFENNYYENTSDVKSLLLMQIMINDYENISMQQILDPRVDLERLAESLLSKASAMTNAVELLNIINQFLLISDALYLTYASRPKKLSLQEVPSDETIFSELKHDVEMDEDESFVLKSKSSIGTTDLAFCVAVCVYGKNHRNKPTLMLGHISLPTVDTLIEMKARFINDNKADPQSVEIYLVGGCIASLENILPIVSNIELGICDMRLCISDSSINEGSSMAIDGSDLGRILYSLNSGESAMKRILPMLPVRVKRTEITEEKSQQQQEQNVEQAFKKPRNKLNSLFFNSSATDETFLDSSIPKPKK